MLNIIVLIYVDVSLLWCFYIQKDTMSPKKRLIYAIVFIVSLLMWAFELAVFLGYEFIF